MNANIIDTNFKAMQLASSIDAGNVQKWIAEISRSIAEFGGETIVPTKIGRSEPFLRRSGARVIDEPLDNDMRSGAHKRLITLASDEKINFTLAHDFSALELALQMRKQILIPVICLLQDIERPTGYFARRKQSKILHMVDHFIVSSNCIARYLIKEHAISDEKISIIYEGFDLNAINPEKISQERTMSLAHSWGAVENVSDLVLIPAVFDELTWRESLMNFAKDVHENSKADLRYVIIGDDDGQGVMDRLEHALYRCAPGKFLLAGHCADIEAAIKLTSTVLCLNSDSQTQFSVALIAQSLGRFVFLPKENQAAEEFLHENITGNLLDDDASKTRIAIENYVAQQHDRHDNNWLSSRSFIIKYFSQAEMHKKLQETFRAMPAPQPGL